MAFFKKDEGATTELVAVTRHGSMPIRKVAIATLRLDEHNARRHPERNLDAIKASLKRFGQRKPIVVHHDVVIAGNGTMLAAEALGWTEITVADASDLTVEEARAYAIADNKTGDLAEWDLKALGDLMRTMDKELLDATGFAAFEYEPLLAAEWKAPTADGSAGEDHSRSVQIAMTAEQAVIVRGAIAKVRETEHDPQIPEGRALELICANFLS